VWGENRGARPWLEVNADYVVSLEKASDSMLKGLKPGGCRSGALFYKRGRGYLGLTEGDTSNDRLLGGAGRRARGGGEKNR